MVNRDNSNSHTNDQYTEKRITDSGLSHPLCFYLQNSLQLLSCLYMNKEEATHVMYFVS